MLVADQWKDFALLDSGNGEKIERWGPYTLRRPDLQAIWPARSKSELWQSVDAVYRRSVKGGGAWEFNRALPARWEISYNRLRFFVEPTGFKHTGLFPEQAVNWDWMTKIITRAKGPKRVLNLFAYTGAATVACAAAGAETCHVDAAKRIVGWAKENLALSGLAGTPTRFIVDDAMKFVQREARRGKRYDAIVMDPPAYGRGPDGEMWRIERELAPLVEAALTLLSDTPLFFLVNAYTTGFTSYALKNLLEIALMKKRGAKGTLENGEIGLRGAANGIVLPSGIYARWAHA